MINGKAIVLAVVFVLALLVCSYSQETTGKHILRPSISLIGKDLSPESTAKRSNLSLVSSSATGISSNEVSKRISHYEIRYFTDGQAEIWCWGENTGYEDRVGYISFYTGSEPNNPNRFDGTAVFISYPLSEFNDVINLLRNSDSMFLIIHNLNTQHPRGELWTGEAVRGS